MRQVEVTVYGIDHAQYFPGHGLAYTSYDYAALGVGNDFAEALDDALDQAAASYSCDLSDTPAVREIRRDYAADTESVSAHLNRELGDVSEREFEDTYGGCELYYYVGLRWSVA
jgi:hypothetical protein